MKFTKDQALRHYIWGNNCQGWEYVESPSLSIKEESMPPGTEEALHYHNHSRQFFFILKGEACFELEGELFLVKERESLTILPSQKHRIMNRSNGDLEFLLVSEPSTKGDRIEIE
jgi:mannose-6-phosphate isomerase-like protein (cupin superfamily)